MKPTKIDALVAEQQRLIELLKEKRQAVISYAVTKGLNPNARMKDSGIEWLGEVPEHWESIALSKATTKYNQRLCRSNVGTYTMDEGVTIHSGDTHKGWPSQALGSILFTVSPEMEQFPLEVNTRGRGCVDRADRYGDWRRWSTLSKSRDWILHCHALIILSPNRSIVNGSYSRQPNFAHSLIWQ